MKKLSNATLLMAGSSLALAGGPAWAQAVSSPSPIDQATAAPAAPSVPEAQTDAQGIQDIVVTANRREETVQRSSLAIQAFGNDQLRSAGLSQATDLNKLVQGLQIANAGSTTQIYIRGVGDFSANSLSNPGVAFNVDGVYVGRPEAVASTFYDVARLEVLKGPQGTLYGRNASGGAINLITRSPSLDEVKGTFNVDVGNYSLFHVESAINVPLSSTIAVRAAVNRVKRDGYLSDGTSDDDQLSGRLKALIKPSDDFSLLFSVDGGRIRGKNQGYVYLPRRPGSSAWEGSQSPAAIAYTATFNPLIAPADGNTFVRNNFFNASAQLDWNLGFATLTVIPAYRHTRYNSLSYNAQFQGLVGKADQETAEARLSHSGASLKWVAGLYFFHEANPGEVRILVGTGLLKSRPTYRPKGTSYAAFGETTLSVTDRLRLIAGGRYTTEKRTLTGDFFIYPTQGDDFVSLETFDGGKRFNSFTWKAGGEFDLAPRSLLFFTASTGFKAGGLTQTIFPSNVYRPEKILAFTLGSRNRFFGNKLQVNLEAFHWTYKDQQNSFLTFDDLGNFNFLTKNAGRAKIYGLNVDIVAQVSKADTLRLAGEYDHSRYSEFLYTVPAFTYNPIANGCRVTGTNPGPFVPLTGLDCSGFELPHAPKWSGLIDYTHSFALASGAAVDFNANVRAASKTTLAVDFTPAERAPSFAIVNAALTYRSPQRNYSVGAFVRNLNKGKEYTGGAQNAFGPPQFTAIIGAPRTYGAQLNLTF